MTITKLFIEKFPERAYRQYGILPLYALPNQSGFMFVGVVADGSVVDCTIEYDDEQYHKVRGVDYATLIGWKNCTIYRMEQP